MNVIVIGASSGIGKEVVHIFSQKGHSVVCSSRDEGELRDLVSDIKIRYGNNAFAIPLDLSDHLSIRQFLHNVFKIFATVECVVVTAATMPSNEMEYHNEEAFLKTIMTNYIGVGLVLNMLSQHMAKNKSGIIICLSSPAGERGRQSNFIYGASKSALTTYLEGLRGMMFRHNVQITTVLPGYVDTPMSYGKVKGVLAVSPNYVAKKIYNLTEKKRDIVYLPPIWWLILKVIKFIPGTIFKRLKM
jgi:short-subunit dehydrogenase